MSEQKFKEELNEVEDTVHAGSVKTNSDNVNISEGNIKIQAPVTNSSNENPQPEQNVNFALTKSQDKLHCSGKKNKKLFKKEGSYDIITKLIVDSFISQVKEDIGPQSEQKLYQIYPNPDELCNECRWLVKATKSSDSMKSSSDDEEFVTKWIESRKCLKSCKENTTTGKDSQESEYSKEDIIRLLAEVHSSLLECNILLTTQKLQSEMRKSETAKNEENLTSETSLNEEWFDEIQEGNDPKDVASKLGFILERFVSKYLKCCIK